MAFVILTSQAAVLATTIVTLILTLGLAVVITKKYLKHRSNALLFWSAGLWLFVITVFEEILFASGIYSEFLIASYLFLVAMLVEALALGSMQLIKSRKIQLSYYAFAVVSTVLLLWALLVEGNAIGNILTDWIVYGNIPTYTLYFSTLITVPAAIVLVAIAIKSYVAKRSNKMLSIIAGVIIVSIAGTLYIVQYPAFLYIAEFVGILALWYGFI